MPTITANTTRTLDGNTDFSIGGTTFSWDSAYLDIEVNGPAYTMSYNITGTDWGMKTLTFQGTSKLVINDSASGANRFFTLIELFNTGGSTVKLATSGFNLLFGGEGIDKVTLGSNYVGTLSLGNGNDVVTTGTGGADVIDVGRGDNTVNVVDAEFVGRIASYDGQDTITVDGLTEIELISSGRGNDTVTTSEGWVAYIDAGRGTDTVNLGSGGADFVSLGRDADTVKLSKLTEAFQSVSLNGGGNISTADDKDSDTVDFSAFTKALKVVLGEPSLVNTGNGFFLLSEFENVTGGQANDNLRGDQEINILKGGVGNDSLAGGLGSDVLTGGAGNDIFLFDTKASSSNVDKIMDFSVAADTIRLDNAVFTKLSGTGTLSAAQFHLSASGAAHDTSDRIIYETDTGKLFYDADGNGSGAAVQFATVSKSLALTAADFFIV